jgi:hypothetical protein
MPVNPKTGKRYRISDDGKNRLHIYGTPGKKGVRHQSSDYRVVKLARPKGYIYNPKNTSYYKVRDDGVNRVNVYQSGRRVSAGPGRSIRALPGLSQYYGAGKAVSDLKYGVPQRTLQTQMGRERAAQNAAYGQIAGYYAGLGGTTKSLMGEAGRVGQATDAQVRQIGSERDQSIRSATPQFGGPLGMVAQNMADAEQQAALNRGASADAANRTFGVQTSGGRQALMGQVGAGQAIAGQERLSTLKGQGQQALNVYADKISELERQKALGTVDSALQLRTADQTYGLNQTKLQQQATNDAERNRLAAERNRIAEISANKPSGGGGSRPKPSNRTPYGATKDQNRAYWNDVSKAYALMKNNPKALRSEATYRAFANRYNEPVAAVARSIVLTGGLTPYAISVMHRAGYAAEGRYKPVRNTPRRPVVVST